MHESTLEKRVTVLEKNTVPKSGGVMRGPLVLFDAPLQKQLPDVDKTGITTTKTVDVDVLYDNQARTPARVLYKDQIQVTTGSTSVTGTVGCTLLRERHFTAIPGTTEYKEIRNSVWSDGSAALATQTIQPFTNNAFPLGLASAKWSDIFSASGVINTSDERLKQDIEDIPDAVFTAWGNVQFYQYLFKDSVDKKGAKARIHTGLVAQKIVEAFADCGLDATRYSLLCYDEWGDEYEDVPVVDAEAVYDDVGNEITPAQVRMERQLVRAAGDCYGIRYEEALCLEAAYQRWILGKIIARLMALEQTVGQA